ncbi:MAG: 7TM domain-containing protein [Planctomycetota bacterium]
MKEHRLAMIVALGCTLLAAVLILMRVGARTGERLSRGDKVWRLTYNVRIQDAKAGARVRVALPVDTPGTRVVREVFIRPNLSMDVVRTKRTGRREAVAVASRNLKGLHLVARFDVHVRRAGKAGRRPSNEPLTASLRSYYLRGEQDIQTTSPTVRDVLAHLTPDAPAKSKLLDRIADYCSENILGDGADAPSTAVDALRRNSATTLGRARAMIALCRAGNIPARLVTGFLLRNTQDTEPHFWVEAHVRDRWVPYDPERNHAESLPQDYLAVRLDGHEIVRSAGGDPVQRRFGIRRLLPPPWSAASRNGSLVDVVDLTRLPAGMQETLAILLLLPLGALITALFRNVVGMQTFGTFTPALLALSFVYADWRTGLAVLLSVALIGLGGRALLNRLRLLMVPRLSLVLTVVVLTLTLAVSVLDCFGLTPSARAVILPLVILTMVIERFHITTEESGVRRSLKLLGGTLLVTACCFALLGWDGLGRLALAFPEGLLFVAAALILIGRYSGYRLTELWRFRDVTREPRP